MQTRAGVRPLRGGAGTLPAASRHWAYFLDIDGTLVDLSSDPGGVRLDTESHGVIADLYAATGGAVALISGRALSDVDRMFPRSRMPAAGQHGSERRDATGQIFRYDTRPDALDPVRRALVAAVARHPALLLEDKELSLALHYRRAPRLGGYAHRLMRSARAQAGEGYTILTGKRVVEMKPSGQDKGLAVCEFMQEEPFRGRVPVFIGDDVTDEHGFAVVNDLRGYSIKVGIGGTAAGWRLRDVRAVSAWLSHHGSG